MKKLIICSLLLFALACQKEEPELPSIPCELENWGQVVITNELDQSAEIFFNGVFQINVSAKATVAVEKVPPGSYLVEAKTAGATYSKSYDFERCKINNVILNP